MKKAAVAAFRVVLFFKKFIEIVGCNFLDVQLDLFFQPACQFLFNRTVDDILQSLLVFQNVLGIVGQYVLRNGKHSILSELSLRYTFGEVFDVSVFNFQTVVFY